MHTTRIAAFLLGAWLASCVFLDVLAVQNLRLPGRLLAAPVTPAQKIIKATGAEDAGLLLRHFAAEQNRYYFANWERTEMVIALGLMAFLVMAMDKRLLPLILAGCMLALVLFEYFAVTPELTYLGRAADFPPENRAFGAAARVWAFTEVFIGAEATKLLIGGGLASYIFTYKSRRRMRSSGSSTDAERSVPLRG